MLSNTTVDRVKILIIDDNLWDQNGKVDYEMAGAYQGVYNLREEDGHVYAHSGAVLFADNSDVGDLLWQTLPCALKPQLVFLHQGFPIRVSTRARALALWAKDQSGVPWSDDDMKRRLDQKLYDSGAMLCFITGDPGMAGFHVLMRNMSAHNMSSARKVLRPGSPDIPDWRAGLPIVSRDVLYARLDEFVNLLTARADPDCGALADVAEAAVRPSSREFEYLQCLLALGDRVDSGGLGAMSQNLALAWAVISMELADHNGYSRGSSANRSKTAVAFDRLLCSLSQPKAHDGHDSESSRPWRYGESTPFLLIPGVYSALEVRILFEERYAALFSTSRRPLRGSAFLRDLLGSSRWAEMPNPRQYGVWGGTPPGFSFDTIELRLLDEVYPSLVVWILSALSSAVRVRADFFGKVGQSKKKKDLVLCSDKCKSLLAKLTLAMERSVTFMHALRSESLATCSVRVSGGPFSEVWRDSLLSKGESGRYVGVLLKDICLDGDLVDVDLSWKGIRSTICDCIALALSV